MNVRVVNTLARRTIDEQKVLILDSGKLAKGQLVVVSDNGRLVKARVVSDGQWPIAVCCDGWDG